MTQDLIRDDYDRALAELYATFDPPRPRAITGCPCCIGTRNIDVILAKPRNLLTGDDLTRYASGVFLTVGGPIDYRYLLPRIFELSATDLGWYPTPEIVVGALKRAEWTTWMASERAAIVGFLSAWLDRWAQGLPEEGGYGDEVESLLCGVALAGIDLTPFLDQMLRPRNGKGLVDLADVFGASARPQSPPEGFWEDAPEGWVRFTTFLASEPVRLRLLEIGAHPTKNTGPQAT